LMSVYMNMNAIALRLPRPCTYGVLV
jgi:hypothetical protein